jgi:hypothetical protein
MAHSNEKLQPSNVLYTLLAPVVFDNVRSTTERTSNRKRQCYGTGKMIAKGDKYINHQFRYDNRILTISFNVDYFYNGC